MRVTNHYFTRQRKPEPPENRKKKSPENVVFSRLSTIFNWSE